MLRMADPAPQPMTTANVGKTCWSTPFVFSVVNASSDVPAPIPTAYSNASFDVHDASYGSPTLPTACGFNGIGSLPHSWYGPVVADERILVARLGAHDGDVDDRRVVVV